MPPKAPRKSPRKFFLSSLFKMKKEVSEKKKILLAEDDNSLRRYIEVVLQKAGYEVLTAEDGLSAMKIVLSNEIGAIVSDDLMPNLTGSELYRTLNQMPQKKEIPFILLSGKPYAEEKSAKYFLIKDDKLNEKLIETLSVIFAI